MAETQSPSPASSSSSKEAPAEAKKQNTFERLYSPHDVCEGAVDYVLHNVNTVQYMIKSIEEITGGVFRRDRIKCLPLVPHSGAVHDANGLSPDRVFAGYMWRSARSDCKAKDVVLLEDHIIRLFNTKHADAFLDRKESEVKKSGDVATSSATSVEKKPSLPSSSPSSAAGAAVATPLPKSEQLLQQLLVDSQQAVLDQVERNIRHELIHAFDDARGNIESADCLHQACSEIRAARLSGDCFVGQEMRKGRLNFFEGGQKCVRRRAVMAVERNPVCRGFSERAVYSVMPKCYSDYEPFAAPVYSLGSYGEAQFPCGALKL